MLVEFAVKLKLEKINYKAQELELVCVCSSVFNRLFGCTHTSLLGKRTVVQQVG